MHKVIRGHNCNVCSVPIYVKNDNELTAVINAVAAASHDAADAHKNESRYSSNATKKPHMIAIAVAHSTTNRVMILTTKYQTERYIINEAGIGCMDVVVNTPITKTGL
jgi:hypothetical protein